MNGKRILLVLGALLLLLLPACFAGNENTMETVPDLPSDHYPSPDLPTPDGIGGITENMTLRPMEEEGKGTGFHTDEFDRILFSMKIKELAEWIDEGESVSDFRIRLRFVLRDAVGIEYYAYPVLTLPIDAQDGKEFSVCLQDKEADCGFCPTAGRSYHVEVTVLKGETELLAGMWKRMQVPSALSDSLCYRPSEIPTEEQRAKESYTVRYLAKEGGTVIGKSEQTVVCGERSESVTAQANEGYLFWCWSDGVKTESRPNDVVVYDKEIYALFTKDELDPGIPNMYISTENRADILSKTYYLDATVSIAGAADEKFNVSSAGASIRCRGNSSYSGTASAYRYNSKNSYRLKLDEKANLLGVGNSVNRDWVLHSNKFDASNLRNYFVWNLANQLDTLSFVPSCTWVNLYVNGDYRGIYMISELVEVADDRVEIDDQGTAPDKGYLVELDMRGQLETGAVEGLTYFYLPGFYDKNILNLREWVIKSDVTTRAENAFIRDYFIRCHAAIMQGDEQKIGSLVEIDTLVDMFILQELSKDVDGGGASIYWQKPKGGKLSFTAPWDYDFGMGSYGVAIKTENFVCETVNGGNMPNLWLQSLLNRDWFLDRLYLRMQEADEMISLAIRSVRMQGELLKPAADRNDRKWNIYGNKFHSYLHKQVSVELDSYDAHIDFLCNWIETRWRWMTNEIQTRIDARTS